MSHETILWAIIVLQIELLIVIIPWRRIFKITLHKHATFIDTSALMDGRILGAAKAGFFPSNIVIPRSVLLELQLLADGSDGDKRAKARHGLDVVALFDEISSLNVTIYNDGNKTQGVDNQLLRLAKKYNGMICTVDYNLNKVATAEKIPVLNINELAGELRMNHLPGEKMMLLITQKGNDKTQGVGHLADGSMVVVEQAGNKVGSSIEIEIIRSLQTVAGRMLFAKKASSTHAKSRAGQATNPRKSSSADDSLVNLINNHQ